MPLKTTILRIGDATELVSLYNALINVYNALYTFDVVIVEYQNGGGIISGRTRSLRIVTPDQFVNYVPAVDRLKYAQFSLSVAPGWLQSNGKLTAYDALGTISNYIAQSFTLRQAPGGVTLAQLDQLKASVINPRVVVLQGLGISQTQITTAVTTYFYTPAAAIDTVQAAGVLGSASIVP